MDYPFTPSPYITTSHHTKINEVINMNILNESVKQTTLDEFTSPSIIEGGFLESEKDHFMDVGAFLSSEEGKYISSFRGMFAIERPIYGQNVPFGYFDTLEDAVAARNILVNNNWDVDKVPESLYSWRFFTEYNPLTHTWEISNLIGDDIVSFGFFKSIPIAKKALDILIENNWDSSHIPLEYYYEDSNIRPFKRSKGTYYGVVRRINFEIVTLASFEDKRDAIAFRNSLFLNNWALEEEEQQFDNFIFIKGDKYTVKNNGEVFGVFNRIYDAQDFVIECVRNNWWNGDSYFT